MKNWNKTGKIKAIVLGILALPNLLMPIGATGPKGFMMILVPLIFGAIAIPLIMKFNNAASGQEIVKPTWNDNPFVLKRPLSLFHFGSFFFLAVGISMLLGAGIRYQTLNSFGLIAVSFGLGILIGIWLTLKWVKSK